MMNGGQLPTKWLNWGGFLGPFQIKNNPAAKVAFMAFSTAPRKAARAQAAAAKLQEKEEEEKVKREGRVPCRQRSQSTSTQSTVVEVHLEEEEDDATKANVSCQQRAKVKPAMLTRGLTYTSLWPSAKDVVITTAPPNHTSSEV